MNEAGSSNTDNTTNNVTANTVETGDTDTTNDTVVATLDVAAPPTANDMAEPMELDHQINSSTPAPPTGTQQQHHTLHHFYTYTELQCLPQRAALIKSILNFFKKAIPDPTFAENIRNCKLHCLVT